MAIYIWFVKYFQTSSSATTFKLPIESFHLHKSKYLKFNVIETELNTFLPKLALFLVLPILVIDLIIHSSSQETIWNSACITIFLNSHILLILSQWYWLFLPFSSLSFHLSFESHLSFLDDINSALAHLPVFSLLSLHSLTQSKDNSVSKITLSLPCQKFFCTTILLLSSKVLF